MKIELLPQQKDDQAEFRSFADREIAPFAGGFDQQEAIPAQLIQKLADRKYLASMLPTVYGGRALDMITYGLLHAEIGRGCSSTRSLLTVHDMVASAILQWGNTAQKETWLPKLAAGEITAAFGLSEPKIGSDAKSIETTATRQGDTFVLNGHKQWITFGQIADLFLIVAQCDGKPTAFLVERHTPGLEIKPIQGMLGTRASMLAKLDLHECTVPQENILRGVGFGMMIALAALDLGRYSVAWGCVGIGQACLDASLHYASTRQQFGVYLKEHQLISEMITNMVTNLKAARLLCYQVGHLRDVGDPTATTEVLVAKYFASTMATKASNDAVQIHGANGCSSDYAVQRYFRDAKVMEIIEGSTQIQQIMIARHAYKTVNQMVNQRINNNEETA